MVLKSLGSLQPIWLEKHRLDYTVFKIDKAIPLGLVVVVLRGSGRKYLSVNKLLRMLPVKGMRKEEEWR